MRITLSKDHVGNTVYAIPTGNNAKRGVKRQEVESFDVVGFGRKYAKIIRYGTEVSVSPESGASQDEISRGYGGNAGYMFFASKEDALKYLDLAEKRALILSNPISLLVRNMSEDLIDRIIEELKL